MEESLELKKARLAMNDALGLKESNSIAPEPKLKSKNQKNKTERRKNKITRRVNRKYDAGDVSTTENMAAARTREGELIDKRKLARKEYLRNFASQLARGEQASPSRASGEGPGKPSTSTTVAGVQAEINDKQAEIQKNKDAYNDIFKSLDNNPNSFINSNLNMDYDKGNSGLSQVDESPATYMQKEYRRKRGY